MSPPMFLDIETGGTKIVARIACAEGRVLADDRWTTTTPDAARDAVVEFATSAASEGHRIIAAGLAAFGPLILDTSRGDVGRMLETTKPGWTGSNLRRSLSDRLGIPIAIDTDVNAAALAELRRGAGRGLPSIAYLTVGTGIGAGLAITAGTLTGAMHPEIGHLRLVRDLDDAASSTCPFHTDCAEGLAAGPAVAIRLGDDDLADRQDVQARVAGYLAQLCVAIVLAWSPHRIVLGGGVGTAPSMLAAVKRAYRCAIGNYGVGPMAREDAFIVGATLADAGLEGALLMAAGLYSEEART